MKTLRSGPVAGWFSAARFFQGRFRGDPSARASAGGAGAGVAAALASAACLGLAPIFGKQAILQGFPPQAVVALRTSLASALLLLVMLVFQRRYLYIYPAGLLGCTLAGTINGLGSLFYYGALGRIDAGFGQLLYALYPLFLALWLGLARQPLSRVTALRLLLALPALGLLTHGAAHRLDFAGAWMMLAASALYALHLPINQRVLYDMPAPTVTLYTLMAMNAVVGPAYLLVPHAAPPDFTAATSGWLAVGGLTLATFFSRLTLFLSVKRLGGMQAALLGLAELLVAVLAAQAWLGEQLSAIQWLGVVLLAVSLALVGMEPARKAAGQPGPVVQ